MATSYADSAQAREWDRRFDEWGRPKAPQVEDFHDYEAAAQERTERQALMAAQELVDRKARAKRVAAAVVAYGEFWGLK
ncbi:hypothetical protein [Pseudomonas moraviensis]|uniref:hypothetical protein n=1 Tax=Pseudomonas moraviensis TaxID=321662 RepID=UPI000D920907|nr:hypothetical protein [Pseudomonas moraviensis]PYC06342.1 hypothetical protein DMX04_00450 [Pseudomonas koreensis]UST60739.1 hypothetical protein NF672_09430 [Pseudomonas moraviensis]UST71127.1 hypothetical protein NF674_09380 [Pseudomonas moraviensis]